MAVTLWNPTNTPQKVRLTAPDCARTDHSMLPGDIAVEIFQRHQQITDQQTSRRDE
jgi:hypothetical protein